jgi:hypothetical protein
MNTDTIAYIVAGIFASIPIIAAVIAFLLIRHYNKEREAREQDGWELVSEEWIILPFCPAFPIRQWRKR